MNEKIYLVDTSSLVILVRYFFPHDQNHFLRGKLIHFIETKKVVYTEAVHEECQRVSKGIVVEELDFLKNHIHAKSNKVIDKKMHNKIDDHFAYQGQKRKLEEANAYNNEKASFINSGDFQLVKYALNDQQSRVIVTEETNSPDNKCFKKIPLICKHENIECINITELFNLLNIKISFHE